MGNGNGKTPVNVVMGALGAGKTTVILGLVKQIAGPDYQVIWLKNEYGDVNVDAKLGAEQGITTTEIMNGCLCCTAIGNIEVAIEQVLEMKPNRVIIETAGTAHPAPVVMELKRFEHVVIDSMIEVVDAANFGGFSEPGVIRQTYRDYVDFVVVNKTGLVDENQLERVMDGVLDAYTGMPIIKTADGDVAATAVIGLDQGSVAGKLDVARLDADSHSGGHLKMQAFSFRSEEGEFAPADIDALVAGLDSNDIWRAKGIVRTPDGWRIMNAVMGRVNWQPFTLDAERTEILFVGPYADEHADAVRSSLDGMGK